MVSSCLKEKKDGAPDEQHFKSNSDWIRNLTKIISQNRNKIEINDRKVGNTCLPRAKNVITFANEYIVFSHATVKGQ
jgi:hypothetical protein